MKFLEMRVSGVIVDPSTYIPMVILKDMEEKKTLPVWVGIMEAAAILTSLESIKSDRPMTHDLAKNIISTLGADVQKVAITDLYDNVFYATLYLSDAKGELIELDARPSDAIAIAMRSFAPILVNESIIDKARVIDLSAESMKSKSSAELRSILENLSAEDFGKYKM
ncbi:MAG: bifunctional nuclease family protein [Deltaproteobacteria bacterium]|nr:bifunctional nuclease family protein [Deltaproteobacteria bacterium]